MNNEDFVYEKKEWHKVRACPGVEPGTSRTLSENHAPRPTSLHVCHSPTFGRNTSRMLYIDILWLSIRLIDHIYVGPH